MGKRNFFRPAHRDKAESGIIKALRAVGATVHQLSGKDIPDLLVGYKGLTYLLEVKSVLMNTRKDGYTRTTRTAVSKGQVDFATAWRGGPVRHVTTPEEALMAIGAPVESELGPRMSMTECVRAVEAAGNRKAKTYRIPVHPKNYEALMDGIAAGAFEMDDEGMVRGTPALDDAMKRAQKEAKGYSVTPAYQRAQTEAVVPKRRKAK